MSNGASTGTCRGLDCSLRDLARHQKNFERLATIKLADLLRDFTLHTGLTMQSVDVYLEQVSTIGDEVPKYVITRIASEPAISR